MRRPRNVLLIVADQWRGDSLGSLGHPAALTPNLDALAAEGVTFTQHFGQSAPCGPARASLLTGLYVMNHRVVANGVPLDERHATLAREVKRAGMDPALIGYTTTTPDPRLVGAQDAAFSEIGDVMHGWRPVAHFDEVQYRNYFAWIAAHGFTLPSPPDDIWRPAEGPAGPSDAPNRIPAHLSDTAWSADHAIEFLHGTRPNRPWLLHLGFYRPHPPFAAPAPWHEAVPADRIPRALRRDPADEGAQHPLMAHFLATQKRSSYYEGGDGPVTPLSDTEIRQTRRAYYGLIAEIDHHLGRVFQALRQSGQWDDTLIVFTSDHGEQLGDHNLLGKLGWFDQSYHLPLIVRDPDARPVAGRRVDAPTESVDLMPTLLDWLDLPVPRACDGVSLRPWLAGETPHAWRDAVHFEYDLRGGWPDPGTPPLGLGLDDGALCVTRTADWKYVHFAGLPPVLYDRRRDPAEMHNVAGDPAHAPLLAEAAQRTLSWRLRHADRTLTHLCASPDGLVERR
ncbi:MAG: sulfatase [Rhodospirillales bacterium 69-11]|nr:alkaline phosphatase family protein [Rhodospirillales bacterium]OJW29837.1 MAG: sulfatase [Rhodospirillales bacterium 69-11]